MMMKYKDVLGKDFKTKTEAYKHYQLLRNQTPLGKKLDETTPITKNAMDKLFKDYFLCKDQDYYERKIGAGVDNWSFGYDSKGGICLWVHQKDKPKIKECKFDVSHWGEKVPVAAKWIFTCFGSGVLMDGDKMHRVKQAARDAVEVHKKNFRDSVKPNCMNLKCGIEIHGLDAEVDHKDPTFITLFNNFFNKYDKEYILNTVNKSTHEDLWYFTDLKIKESWIDYHLNNCNLQLLCVPCHKNKTYGRIK